MPRVLLNFQHYGNAPDRPLHRGRLPDDHRPQNQLLQLPFPDSLRSFVTRCQPEDDALAGFERRSVGSRAVSSSTSRWSSTKS